MIKRFIRKALKGWVYLVFLTIAVLLLLEVAYRYQVIDFYSNSFQYLNRNEDLNNSKPDVLVIGDSFSAQAESYVDQLRSSDSNLTIINASVPGTGIKQHQLILEKRLRKYAPKLVLYQIYVGNDLTDIAHPINFSTNSVLRNLYWFLGDELLCIPFLNSRMGVLKSHEPIDHPGKTISFEKGKYTPRCKLYIRADPALIDKMVHVNGEYHEINEELIDKLKVFHETLQPETQFVILVIPHCVQVHKMYQHRFEQLGATFSKEMQSTTYPFISELQAAFPGIEVINALPELREEKEPFYANDPHTTVIGQKKLTESVTKSKTYRSLLGGE